MSKRISGVLFHFAYKNKLKGEAQQYANLMRKKGHRARVIKEEGKWKVYRDKY